MNLSVAVGLLAAFGFVAFLAVVLDPRRPPRHPVLRGVREIFHALEGRPLPTPRNALIWWRGRGRRRDRA